MKITFVILLLGVILVQHANSQFGLPKPTGPFKPSSGPISVLTKPVKATLQLFTQQFLDFKNKFHKTYPTKEEEEKRLGIFSSNHVKILDFQKIGDLPFIVHVNEFCDLVLDEFNKLLNGLKIKPYKGKPLETYKGTEEKVVDRFDWRDKGVVTPIKNQGECASCYAFASSAAIESHVAIQTGKKVNTSPQDLVDCSLVEPYENYGCEGGSLEPAYDFVKDQGIFTDSSYPYTAKTGENCKRSDGTTNVATNIVGYINVEEGNDDALKEALVKNGPIAVGLDASAESFQFYGGGIYYEKDCKSDIENINHAVLLIGYGEETNGEKYWLIKNSYGTTWGEEGYAKIARNVTNHCGISTYAIFPKIQ